MPDTLKPTANQACATAHDLATDNLRRLADTMRAEAQKLEDFPNEPEAIHDLRVASRRMRAVLTEFRNLFGPEAWNQSRARIRRITKRLGAPRELDVTRALIEFDGTLKAHHANDLAYVLDRLAAERAAHDDHVLGVVHDVQSDAFAQSMDSLLAAYRPSPLCVLDHAEQRLTKHLKKARKKYKAWTKSKEDEDLHQLRIALKKFRYAIEIYQPLYDKLIKDARKQLKAVQDSLGEWNDDRNLLAHLERLANEEGAPDSRLMGMRLHVAERADAAFDHVTEEVTTFFAKASRKNLESIIANTATPCCQKN
jgi:CHAD domain-containing protein